MKLRAFVVVSSLSLCSVQPARRPAPIRATQPAPRFELGHFVPGYQTTVSAIASNATQTLFVDGTLRAIVTPGAPRDEDRVTVAAERPTHPFSRWFSRADGGWVFVTTDGLVLGARTFLGPFETRAELPDEPAQSEAPAASLSAVKLRDGRWWALDDPAHPRPMASIDLDRAYDVAFIDDRRVLALSAPGNVSLSVDGGRTFRPIELASDVGVELVADATRVVRVQGLSRCWALSDRATLVESSDQCPMDHVDPASISDRVARYRSWRRRVLWPGGDRSSPNTSDGIEVAGALLRRVEGGSTHVTIERRDGGSVLVASELAARWFPFGSWFAQDLSTFMRASPSIRLIDSRGATVEELIPPRPSGLESSVFAEDGSAIALPSEQGVEHTLWTRASRWIRWTPRGAINLRHAHGRALFGATRDAIVEARIGPDGHVLERDVLRFDHARSARDTFATLKSSSQHNGVRAWLFSNDDRDRCTVVVEDGAAPAEIHVPSCGELSLVQFVDRRFGLVAGANELRITRDGATWTPLTVASVRVDSWSGDSSQLSVRDGAIIVAPGHRITREFAERSPLIVSRSAELTEGREPIATDGPTRRTSQCLPTRARAARTPTAAATVFFSAVESGSPATLSVRWSLGATSGRYDGPSPWRPVRGESHIVHEAVSEAGAVVTRSHMEEGRTERAAYVFSRGATPTPIRARSTRSDPPQIGELWVEPADGRWLVVFRHVEEPSFYQWQRLSPDGRVEAWGDLVVPDASLVGFGSIDRRWGAVFQRFGEQPEFTSFEPRVTTDLDVGRDVDWCTEAETPTEDRLALRAHDELDLSDATGGLLSGAIGGVRAELRSSGGSWCVHAIEKDATRVSATPPRGDRPASEPRAAGQWAWYGGSDDTVDVRCRGFAWDGRMIGVQ
jgi:hypothetical protein